MTYEDVRALVCAAVAFVAAAAGLRGVVLPMVLGLVGRRR
jgi:hypothetical protein